MECLNLLQQKLGLHAYHQSGRILLPVEVQDYLYGLELALDLMLLVSHGCYLTYPPPILAPI